MVCPNCGARLDVHALHCWKCGQPTPNYTPELQAQDHEAQTQQMRDEWAWEHAGEALPSGKKVVCVYKEAMLREQLVGWLDEYGNTYKLGYWALPQQQPNWSVDEQGQIYLEAGEAKTLIGWVDYHDVYAQCGRPVSGYFSVLEGTNIYRPKMSFAPDLVFQVSDDGTVYQPIHHGARSVGTVVGAPDFNTIAALALIVLW